MKLFVPLLVLLALGGGFLFYWQKSSDKNAATESAIDVPAPIIPAKNTGEKTYSKLTGDEFKRLFLDSSHPNTKNIVDPPTITGDKALDDKIRSLAEARGYILQKVPKTDLQEIDGALLQHKLAESWSQLRDQAAKEGITLKIESGMRTVDEQRQLFLERLGTATSDAQINQVLSMTAPPGYSRHHSGYVIDIADESAAVFEYSGGYKWLSKDDFLVAKKLGVIPSYPNGAKNQGPEPEAWEYVWVGEELLLQAD